MASRRAAEEFIRAGRVTVNGVVVQALGMRADPEHDEIAVDGERLARAGMRVTVLVHKPRGVVSTLADPEGRPTVRALAPGLPERLYPIGRLDVNTTGLLLLTNDGALAQGLLHPRHGVSRVYHAKVRGSPAEEAITRLRRGVRLEDGKAASTKVRVLERRPTKTWLEITVHEGRRHLVRRLCDAVGHPVEKLMRVRLGPLALGPLAPGAWRPLTPRELAALRAAAGLSGGRARGEPGGGPRAGARGRRRGAPRSAPPRPAAARAAASPRPGRPPRPGGPRPRPRPS